MQRFNCKGDDWMKILYAEFIAFALPDDFNGGLSDALRLLADYHEEVEREGKPQEISEIKDTVDVDEAWQDFIKGLPDKKLVAAMGVQETGGATSPDAWIYRDPKHPVKRGGNEHGEGKAKT